MTTYTPPTTTTEPRVSVDTMVPALVNGDPTAISGRQIRALLAAINAERSTSEGRLPTPTKLALDWGSETKQGPFPTQLAIWLQQMEDYFKEHRTEMDRRCRVASHFLSGRAQLEYVRLRTQKGEGMTWDHLLHLLRTMAKATTVTPVKNRIKVLTFNMVEAVYTDKKVGDKPHPLEYGMGVLEACMDDGHLPLPDPWRATVLYLSLPQSMKDVITTKQALANLDNYQAMKDFVIVNRDLFDRHAASNPPGSSNKRRATDDRHAGVMAVDAQEYQAPRQDYHATPRQDYNPAPRQDYNPPPRQDYHQSPRRDEKRRDDHRGDGGRGSGREDYFTKMVRNMRAFPNKRSALPPTWVDGAAKKREGRKGHDTYWIKGVSATLKLQATEDGECAACRSRSHDFFSCTRAQKELKFPDEYFFYARK